MDSANPNPAELIPDPASTARGRPPTARGNSPTLALLSLSLGYFTLGTVSLSVVGLSGPIHSDLHVAPSTVGLLVTVFAVVFAIAAPLAPIGLSRVGRKHVLLLGLAMMALGGLGCAMADSYGELCALRVVAGLGAAVFGPAASAAGSMLVPEGQRAKALAEVFAGMTAATVLGVPLASTVGDAVGWRWALAGTAGLTVLALILVAVFVPGLDATAAPTFRVYGQVLRTPGTLPTVGTSLLTMAAQFTVYGVVGAFLKQGFGAAPGSVTGMLLAFGVAGVAGNTFGSRIYARLGGTHTITLTLAGLAAAFASLVAIPHTLGAAIPPFLLWAFCSGLYQAPQQARLVALLPGQRGILLALNASALYLGISLGSLAGSSLLPPLGTRLLPELGLGVLAVAGVAHYLSTHHVPHVFHHHPADGPRPQPPAEPALDDLVTFGESR